MTSIEGVKNKYNVIVKEGSDNKNKIRNEITNMKKTLETAYSANIIPMQFRNIDGVYYLYDYLLTSNQSLSEAIMQAKQLAYQQAEFWLK